MLLSFASDSRGHREHRSTALPVELSSPWERCAHLIQFKCTRYSWVNTIRDDLQCFNSISESSSEKHEEKISWISNIANVSRKTVDSAKSWLEVFLLTLAVLDDHEIFDDSAYSVYWQYTNVFLSFDLYFNTAYAAHNVYNIIHLPHESNIISSYFPRQ